MIPESHSTAKTRILINIRILYVCPCTHAVLLNANEYAMFKVRFFWYAVYTWYRLLNVSALVHYLRWIIENFYFGIILTWNTYLNGCFWVSRKMWKSHSPRAVRSNSCEVTSSWPGLQVFFGLTRVINKNIAKICEENFTWSLFIF